MCFPVRVGCLSAWPALACEVRFPITVPHSLSARSQEDRYQRIENEHKTANQPIPLFVPHSLTGYSQARGHDPSDSAKDENDGSAGLTDWIAALGQIREFRPPAVVFQENANDPSNTAMNTKRTGCLRQPYTTVVSGAMMTNGQARKPVPLDIFKRPSMWPEDRMPSAGLHRLLPAGLTRRGFCLILYPSLKV